MINNLIQLSNTSIKLIGLDLIKICQLDMSIFMFSAKKVC